MIATLLSLTLSFADSTCRTAPDLNATRLLDTAVERTGLAAARGRALHVTGFDIHDHQFESDRMFGPSLVDVTNIDQWFDAVTGVERTSSRITIAGFQFDAGTVTADEGHAFRMRDSSSTGSEADHASSWSTRPLNVWAMLDDWVAASDVRGVGRCLYRDYSRAVLVRHGARGEERLFIDEKSGYPVKLDRIEPHYLWGQMRVEFLYSTWQLADGVHLPGAAFRIDDGVPTISRVFAKVQLAPRDSVALHLPAGEPMGFALAQFLVPSRPDTIRVSTTTFVLRNPGYAETVTLARDTVFVFDATQGDDRGRHDAEWITALFPGKHPIVVVVTDLAWPHVAGVRYWVAQGATIVSHRAARSFLQQVVDRRWTRAPDALERTRAGHPLRFRGITDSVSLGGGAILLFPIDGAASEVALAAFIRKDAFLWASDFIQTLTAPSQYLDEVWGAVQRVGVTPSAFGAEHVGVSEWARVAALASRPRQ
jgi:hypothetical protein